MRETIGVLTLAAVLAAGLRVSWLAAALTVLALALTPWGREDRDA